MGTRRKSRELAMQMLFQGDLGKQKPEEVEELFWASREDVDDETRGFADDLRLRQRQRIEEAVAETKIKIIFPLVFFIFPCLLIVLLGPALLNITKDLKNIVQ